MRRLPIYFLVDVSESMVGTPVEQVQEGMRAIIQDLRVDPYALETVFVSIIAFAGQRIVATHRIIQVLSPRVPDRRWHIARQRTRMPDG